MGVLADFVPSQEVAGIDRAVNGLIHRLDVDASFLAILGRPQEELVT